MKNNMIMLSSDWNLCGYNENIFAFRCGKHLVEENISQDRVCELIESFYEEGFDDWSVEYWDNRQWNVIPQTDFMFVNAQ